MIKNEIKMKCENYEIFDKKQIALAIRNSTINDELSCSLLKDNVLSHCRACGLKEICESIDNVMDEYDKKNNKVINTFEF